MRVKQEPTAPFAPKDLVLLWNVSTDLYLYGPGTYASCAGI